MFMLLDKLVYLRVQLLLVKMNLGFRVVLSSAYLRSYEDHLRGACYDLRTPVSVTAVERKIGNSYGF